MAHQLPEGSYSTPELMLAFVQQLLQILLPDGSVGVSTMAMGLVRDGQQNEAPVFHLFDLLLGNAEFWRVDEIVGRIDEHDRRDDLIQILRRVIVARSAHRKEQVVCI